MGLDISAYRQVRLEKAIDSYQDIDAAVYEGCSGDYGYIRDGRIDGLAPGWYEFGEAESSFRAGSYSGYNDFRDHVSLGMLGVPAEEVWKNRKKYEGLPGYELVDFSDCEGTIGPKTSAKLLEDFRTFRKKFAEMQVTGPPKLAGEYMVYIYDLFMAAFEVAADYGVVQFH